MIASNLDLDWQVKSLCKKALKLIPETGEFVPYTYDDFYPPTGKSVSNEVIALCKRCPAKKQCLEYALHHEKYGYWANTTENQRIEIRRKRGIKYRAPQSFAW